MSTEEADVIYDDSGFEILDGLDPVKKRPDMYTRTDYPLHIIQEVIDNSVDEALGGFCTKIDVELFKDGSVQVSDNGRGIPVGLHKEKKIPVVLAAYSMLHAGGKFSKTEAGSAYRFSGGLHGVGVAVTNALSSRLDVEVRREGQKWHLAFEDGNLVEPLHLLGNTRGSGTRVRALPNPKHFDSPKIPEAQLEYLLRSKAALCAGLVVTLTDHRGDGAPVEKLWEYTDGLREVLNELADGEPSIVTPFSSEKYVAEGDETFAEGEGAAWAFGWYESGRGEGQSFTNLIPTPSHGTHVAGLKAGIFDCLRVFIDNHALLPKGVKLNAEDTFKNVKFVLSAKVLDPKFAGQTKEALNSRDAVKLVDRVVRSGFEVWLNHNVHEAKTIAELAIRNAQTRLRDSKKTERKKSSSVVMLPGKLTDCESEDSTRNELFLVEGDSAGGSAKMGRNKEYQAILPLRGKGLNTWEVERDRVLSNNELHDITVALGVEPHGEDDNVDFSRLRYHKVCILADADVDGFHIQVLLLTAFVRHYPQLVSRGHVYIARPPLYRVDVESAGKKRLAKKIYAMDEEELVAVQERLRTEGYSKWRASRFKGLGEMDSDELWDTTLNPDTRSLLQAHLPPENKTETFETFDMLMNKSRASSRREWMERRGDEVEV
jgi:topoisomerase-4 subunit B